MTTTPTTPTTSSTTRIRITENPDRPESRRYRWDVINDQAAFDYGFAASIAVAEEQARRALARAKRRVG